MKRVKLYRPDNSATITVSEQDAKRLTKLGWTDKQPTKPKQSKEDK